MFSRFSVTVTAVTTTCVSSVNPSTTSTRMATSSSNSASLVRTQGLNKKGVAKPLLKKSIYSQFSDDDDSYSDCSDVLVAVGSKEHSGGKKKKLTKGKKWKKQKIQNIENVMSKLAQKLEVLAAQRDSDSAEETRDSMETSKTPEKLR